MPSFRSVVKKTDEITDLLPGISTIKGISIWAYQRAHKVNLAANPRKTSWIDDIKIHVLSKSDFDTKLPIIPFFGNIVCLVKFVLASLNIKYYASSSTGYLSKAAWGQSYGTKKHGYEIAALYLSRNPKKPAHKLARSFERTSNNYPIFNLILKSRKDWSPEDLKKAFRYAETSEASNYIMQLNGNLFTDEEASRLVEDFALLGILGHPEALNKIRALVDKHPSMNMSGDAIVRLAAGQKTNEMINLLLERFPGIAEVERKRALLETCHASNIEAMCIIERHSPGLTEKYLGEVIDCVAAIYDNSVLEWILTNYAEKITPSQIGKVLEKLARGANEKKCADPLYNAKCINLIKEIVAEHPELPSEIFFPAMRWAADSNPQLFDLFLELPQMGGETVQKLLDHAVYISEKYKDLSDVDFIKNNLHALESIKSKFPYMVAGKHDFLD